MTTLVAVIGEAADEAVAVACRRATNLAREPVPDLPEDLPSRFEVLASAWRRAARRSAVYTLVAADPLEPLVAAWEERLAGGEDHLEPAIGLVGRRPLPDFYVVEPALPHPRIDWYAGLLVDRAPSRVRFSAMTPAAITAAVAGVAYGPSLPGSLDLAMAARDYVPLPQLAASPGNDDRPAGSVGGDLATGGGHER